MKSERPRDVHNPTLEKKLLKMSREGSSPPVV